MNNSIQKVTQFINSRTDRPVMNHFIITDNSNSCKTFRSYDSTIAVYNPEKKTLTIGKHYDYSTTTSKHFCDWLRQIFRDDTINLPKLRKTIEKGEIRNCKIIYDENLV